MTNKNAEIYKVLLYKTVAPKLESGVHWQTKRGFRGTVREISLNRKMLCLLFYKLSSVFDMHYEFFVV